MLNIEELGIEGVSFEQVTTLTGIKETLRKGDGICLNSDCRIGICYSESKGKLYLLESTYDEDTLNTAEADDLTINEVEIEQADKLIEEYLEDLKKEEDRRRKYDDWLSKSKNLNLRSF